jgi:hypothetical protein
MRFCAGSTAVTPATNQAVRVRRPLRRRPDTIARPARVRIRSRKPCTRARRRLFGWKVRFPLATTFSSSRLAPCSARATRGRTRLPARSPSRASCLAANRRGPRAQAWFAAVSPTSGRLFEGTDPSPPGQTRSALSNCTVFTPVSSWCASLSQSSRNIAERLARVKKTVSFGHAVPTGNGARQRDGDGESTGFAHLRP